MNTPNSNHPSPRVDSPEFKRYAFDHEKLDVYQLELQFIAWVTPLIEEAKERARGKTSEVCDQLDRASRSALLKTAEGNGKRQRPVRAKFFDDARGSATECAGCLDAMVAKGVFEPGRIAGGKAILVRIVSILCKLIDRFDHTGGMLREEPVEYRISRRVPDESRTRTRTRTRTKKAG
jgi:four helix bundle protein